jgi:hypothetical protein
MFGSHIHTEETETLHVGVLDPAHRKSGPYKVCAKSACTYRAIGKVGSTHDGI